ncbi:MAG: SDR family NAD(P)-dependent oxidoreductase [Myxococcota bacterium]
MRVLVTGATGALGTAVCERLLSDGHEVHGTYVVEAEAARAQERLGEKVALSRVDVTDEASVRGWFAAAGAPVDALVHVAGGFVMGPIEAATIAQFDQQVALNLRSLFLCAREAVATMKPRGSGRIVAVGARGAVEPGANTAIYAATKAGVLAMIRALGEELRGTGVGAYAVLPHLIDTPANRAAGLDPARMVAPAEIAGAIGALLEPRLAIASGAWLPVYGR